MSPPAFSFFVVSSSFSAPLRAGGCLRLADEVAGEEACHMPTRHDARARKGSRHIDYGVHTSRVYVHSRQQIKAMVSDHDMIIYGINGAVDESRYVRTQVAKVVDKEQKDDAEWEQVWQSYRDAFEDARTKFDVRFYLVAILFIIFDLEVAFLFPWAISFGNIGLFGFWSMVLFLIILTVGFIYEWRKGALEWD